MSLAPIQEGPVRTEDAGLRQYLDILARRKMAMLLVFLLVMGLGAAAAFAIKPSYRAVAKVVVPATSMLRPAARNDSVDEIEAVAAGAPPSIAAQVDEMKSKAFIEAGMKATGIDPRSADAPKVKVETPEFLEADVITVTVEGRDPAKASRLANSLAGRHVSGLNRRSSEGLLRALRFVRQARQAAAAELARAESALRDFRTRYPVDQWSAEQETRYKQVVELRNKVLEARSGVASLQQQLQELKARLREEPPYVPSNVERDNPQRALLEEKLRQLRVQRLELLKDLQPGSPDVQAQDDLIAEVQRQLRLEPRTVKEVVQVPNPRRALLEPKVTEVETALLGHQENYRATLRELREKDVTPEDLVPLKAKLVVLTQDQERAHARYHTLSERLQTLELRQNAQTARARVIDEAEVPDTPVMPHKALLLVLAGIAAVFLALGAAFLQELLDDRLSSADLTERVTAVPALAHVPSISPGRGTLIGTLPDEPPVVDAYRALRTGIGFAGMDAPIRRLLITSANPGEGKTTTAVNLATAMAMDGKRVLLVDGDLRCPNVHHVLGLAEGPGLSDVLLGTQRPDAVICRTDVANLSVLTAGTPAPNAAELFGSEHLEYLLEHLESRADIVIWDSSPCVAVADPLVLATRMDGVLLVIGCGKTRRGSVTHALDLLHRARARVIGTVLNRGQAGRRSAYQRYQAYAGGGRREGAAALTRRPAGADEENEVDAGPERRIGARAGTEGAEDVDTRFDPRG